MKTASSKGFTLIELLVVITILAVLAGAALPYVQAYVEESRIAKAKTDLEEIARALAVYETREGDYPDTPTPAAVGLSDVSQLTGRYLNKAPIDPWGNSYIVDLNAGTVYSMGPDRLDAAPADKLDNISFPYQPPLALVSVKWVDRNQSGAVDTQNTPDQVQLAFSRRLNTVSCTSAAFDDSVAGQVNTLLNIKVNAVNTLFNTVFSDAAANVVIVGGKTVVFDVGGGGFTPGRDSVNVIGLGPNYITDNAAPTPNRCLADQDVKILAQ